MFCTQCGASNPDGSRFCSHCGRAMLAASTTEGAANTAAFTPTAPPSDLRPTKASGKARASVICGVVSFFVPALLPVAIAAIILGHISLSDIRKAGGRLSGQRTAVTGCTLGYLGVVMFVIVASIEVPNLLRARMVANEASAVSSLRTIASACVIYSSTFENGFAPDLGTLDGAGREPPDCRHAQLISEELATGSKNGYHFTYAPKQASGDRLSRVSPEAASKGCTAPGATGFTVIATPISSGTTGIRRFFVDETGVIRYASDGVASEDSPPVQ